MGQDNAAAASQTAARGTTASARYSPLESESSSHDTSSLLQPSHSRSKWSHADAGRQPIWQRLRGLMPGRGVLARHKFEKLQESDEECAR